MPGFPITARAEATPTAVLVTIIASSTTKIFALGDNPTPTPRPTASSSPTRAEVIGAIIGSILGFIIFLLLIWYCVRASSSSWISDSRSGKIEEIYVANPNVAPVRMHVVTEKVEYTATRVVIDRTERFDRFMLSRPAKAKRRERPPVEYSESSESSKNNLDSEALAQYKMSKTYFLVPTRDTPPSGPIFLGSIITSPRSPELSINSKKSALLSTLEVQETTLKDSSRHLSLGSKGKTGIWAEFIGGMGIGGELSTTWENTSTSTYKFAELVTRTISPSLGEIQAIFQGQDVQSCIKDSRFRDNLYIITGVKIAKGANVVIEKVRARGGNLNFGVDATPLGVPIKVGPDIEVSKEAGQGLEERHEDAFVFAYRLREIKYRRKVVEKQTEYLKGDLMGVGPGEEKKGAVDDLMELVDGDDEAELLKFDERDVKGGDFDADETAAVDDDGEEVIVIRFDDDDED